MFPSSGEMLYSRGVKLKYTVGRDQKIAIGQGPDRLNTYWNNVLLLWTWKQQGLYIIANKTTL